MQIQDKKDYNLISVDENNFNTFFTNLENEFDLLKENHIILNFDNVFSANLNDLLSLISISETQKDNNLSFIIVIQGINIDDVPDELSIAPTLHEAIDTLDMENMQRDLLSGLDE